MEKNNGPKKFSKREFIKSSAFAMGGCMLGFGGIESFSRCFNNAPCAPPPSGIDRWTREALYYTKTADGLLCRKCPHGCLLQEGESGICRNRVVHDGKLYTIGYGNPCAVHIDPIEKKPLFHFLPATKAFSIAVAGCNLRCLNCQNWQISQVSPKETENYDLMPEKAVEECLKSGSESIAYTYSEPTTFYEYVLDTAGLAKREGIKNILKSSGYISEIPLRRLSKVVHAANIDLKSFDNGIYRKLCGAELEPVLKTLKTLKDEGVWLEITNLIIPGWTDDPEMIKKMCAWLTKNGLEDCPLHFSRFSPLYKLTQLPLTPVSILEKAREIALGAGVSYVYIGNVPAHAAENTYCRACKKMIIERKGFTILADNVTGGKCKFCGTKIPGIWKSV